MTIELIFFFSLFSFLLDLISVFYIFLIGIIAPSIFIEGITSFQEPILENFTYDLILQFQHRNLIFKFSGLKLTTLRYRFGYIWDGYVFHRYFFKSPSRIAYSYFHSFARKPLFCWSFGKWGIFLYCHRTLIRSSSTWYGSIYGLNRTKLCPYAKLNCLEQNCFDV